MGDGWPWVLETPSPTRTFTDPFGLRAEGSAAVQGTSGLDSQRFLTNTTVASNSDIPGRQGKNPSLFITSTSVASSFDAQGSPVADSLSHGFPAANGAEGGDTEQLGGHSAAPQSSMQAEAPSRAAAAPWPAAPADSPTRASLRTLCQPFFEQMLDVIETAVADGSLGVQSLQELSLASTWPQLSAKLGIAACPGGKELQALFDDRVQKDALKARSMAGLARSAEQRAAFGGAGGPPGPLPQLGSIFGRETTPPDAQGTSSALSGASATSERRRRAPAGRGGRGPAAKDAKDQGCTHWKSKGWCRYGDECKFEHARGARGSSSFAPVPRSNVVPVGLQR